MIPDTLYQFRWFPQSDDFKTKRDTKFRIGIFPNGTKCLLFPIYHDFEQTVEWYAPTESTIFFSGDDEIIEIYEIIDAFNKEYHKFERKLLSKCRKIHKNRNKESQH